MKLTKETLAGRLGEMLTRHSIDAAAREQRNHRIADHVLRSSAAIDQRNFTRVAKSDLARMVEAYDALYFDGACVGLARHYGITFRLSSRMTSAGGKTTRTTYAASRRRQSRIDYEIAISTSLLFQTFREDKRAIRVCGLTCNDRLAAMQRIVEHELVHLAEMLVWIHSDCAAKRFQGIAGRFFGHTEHRHELVTQRERAQTEFNIRLGDWVSFENNGRMLIGRVNRITRRATVLVLSPRGELFSDGRRYERYYVPLQQLRKAR